MNHTRIAQLMCSKVCHDLITPVGAITNSMEIMQENTPEIDEELLLLALQSANNASKKLVYYRAAFGFSGVQLIDSPVKLQDMLAQYLMTHKINLEFTHHIAQENITVLHSNIRIILNIVGIMAECAPYGGKMQIAVDLSNQKQEIKFHLKGNLVKIKTDNQSALQGNLDDTLVTSSSIQSFLAGIYIQENTYNITSLDSSKENFTMILTHTGDNKAYKSLF